MGAFSFPKSERLSKQKSIQELLGKGSSFYLYPFRIFVRKSLEDRTQVLMSVSKRNFKRAVDRNLIKRRMREAYRLHKQLLGNYPKLQIAYIYTAKEILLFKEIEKKLLETFKRFSEYVEKD